jgi:hypothetical protein
VGSGSNCDIPLGQEGCAHHCGSLARRIGGCNLKQAARANWDSTITLAYADEQLGLAAQFLTSGLLSLAGSVAAAYERHVPSVVQHGALLPPKLLARLQSSYHTYSKRTEMPLDNKQLEQLRTDVLESRDHTRAALNEIQQEELRRISEELLSASLVIVREGAVPDPKQLSRLVGEFKRAALTAAKTRDK